MPTSRILRTWARDESRAGAGGNTVHTSEGIADPGCKPDDAGASGDCLGATSRGNIMGICGEALMNDAPARVGRLRAQAMGTIFHRRQTVEFEKKE